MSSAGSWPADILIPQLMMTTSWTVNCEDLEIRSVGQMGRGGLLDEISLLLRVRLLRSGVECVFRGDGACWHRIDLPYCIADLEQCPI